MKNETRELLIGSTIADIEENSNGYIVVYANNGTKKIALNVEGKVSNTYIHDEAEHTTIEKLMAEFFESLDDESKEFLFDITNSLVNGLVENISFTTMASENESLTRTLKII